MKQISLGFEIVRKQTLILETIHAALSQITEITGVPAFLGGYVNSK